MSDTNLHPIEWFNFFGSFKDIFKHIKNAHLINDNECAISTSDDPNPNKPTFKLTTNVEVLRDNPYFKRGTVISKFQLLCAVQFKFDIPHAISHIQYELMGDEIPYIRVGTDYYKVIKKDDRYGGTQTHLKAWKIDTIKHDHSKALLQSIPKFDDFIIKPDNKDYQPIIKNCYNLYSAFAHQPKAGEINTSLHFMSHIFGEQLDLGLKYLKILYEKPEQMLPILTLASKERDTGKTTFINWMEMIFGSNTSLISPEDLLHTFNSNYATKNVILVDETFIEKQSGVEKLKSLSTAKSIKVSQKNVAEYNIPFYGKFILCTNKIRDFMRIDEDEVRFWIREIPQIQGKKNVLIEKQLMQEVPAFLEYLSSLPAINYDSGSRMVFTKDEIKTEALRIVKEESRAGFRRSLEIHINEFFDKNDLTEFYATVSEIKDYWFKNNHKIDVDYISKVLRFEMNLQASKKSIRYFKFDEVGLGTVGKPYCFKRTAPIEKIEEEPPF